MAIQRLTALTHYAGPPMQDLNSNQHLITEAADWRNPSHQAVVRLLVALHSLGHVAHGIFLHSIWQKVRQELCGKKGRQGEGKKDILASAPWQPAWRIPALCHVQIPLVSHLRVDNATGGHFLPILHHILGQEFLVSVVHPAYHIPTAICRLLRYRSTTVT